MYGHTNLPHTRICCILGRNGFQIQREVNCGDYEE